MIYLASPYSHPDPEVMEARFDEICRIAGYLMGQGEVVFSPISHTHPIAVRSTLPRGWDYWERVDREFILASAKLVVAMIDGWRESIGVQAEISIAKDHGIPIEYLRVDGAPN